MRNYDKILDNMNCEGSEILCPSRLHGGLVDLLICLTTNFCRCFYNCMAQGNENGCTEAEFLAIDDEDFQHRRLVRFYKHSGFKVIKYVGDDFQDIPARMVWGGCGTLMRAKIDDLLPFWTMLLSRSSSSEK